MFSSLAYVIAQRTLLVSGAFIGLADRRGRGAGGRGQGECLLPPCSVDERGEHGESAPSFYVRLDCGGLQAMPQSPLPPQRRFFVFGHAATGQGYYSQGYRLLNSYPVLIAKVLPSTLTLGIFPEAEIFLVRYYKRVDYARC